MSTPPWRSAIVCARAFTDVSSRTSSSSSLRGRSPPGSAGFCGGDHRIRTVGSGRPRVARGHRWPGVIAQKAGEGAQAACDGRVRVAARGRPRRGFRPAVRMAGPGSDAGHRWKR